MVASSTGSCHRRRSPAGAQQTTNTPHIFLHLKTFSGFVKPDVFPGGVAAFQKQYRRSAVRILISQIQPTCFISPVSDQIWFHTLTKDNFQPRGFAVCPSFAQQVNFLDVQRRPGETPLVLTINISNYYPPLFSTSFPPSSETSISLSAWRNVHSINELFLTSLFLKDRKTQKYSKF